MRRTMDTTLHFSEFQYGGTRAEDFQSDVRLIAEYKPDFEGLLKDVFDVTTAADIAKDFSPKLRLYRSKLGASCVAYNDGQRPSYIDEAYSKIGQVARAFNEVSESGVFTAEGEKIILYVLQSISLFARNPLSVNALHPQVIEVFIVGFNSCYNAFNSMHDRYIEGAKSMLALHGIRRADAAAARTVFSHPQDYYELVTYDKRKPVRITLMAVGECLLRAGCKQTSVQFPAYAQDYYTDSRTVQQYAQIIDALGFRCYNMFVCRDDHSRRREWIMLEHSSRRDSVIEHERQQRGKRARGEEDEQPTKRARGFPEWDWTRS